jgi:hypothetical protein
MLHTDKDRPKVRVDGLVPALLRNVRYRRSDGAGDASVVECAIEAAKVINRGSDQGFDISRSSHVCMDEEAVAPGRSDLTKHIFAPIPAPRSDDYLGALDGQSEGRRRAQT